MTNNRRGLIGYTGFVGYNLDKQTNFSDKYNSKNIDSINGEFDLLVCAGARAEKWLINQNPEIDLESIEKLIRNLKRVKVRKVVLISTVDIYPTPINVDEKSIVDVRKQSSYGKHRYYLENFIEHNFDTLCVRLPGLFGPGLKKNIIFDLLNNKQLDKIDPNSSFQWYDVSLLWRDIEIALNLGIKTLNMATEPIKTQTLIEKCFPEKLKVITEKNDIPSTMYDMHSIYVPEFGGSDNYLYSRNQIIESIKNFVMKEKSKI